MDAASDLSVGSFSRLDRARWRQLVAGDLEYRIAARWTTFSLRLEAGTDVIDVAVQPIGLSFDVGTLEDGADSIVLSGSPAAWDAFLRPLPTPPNHSILGMERRRDDFRITSDRHQLLRNLRPLTIALGLMRLATTIATSSR